MEDAPAHARLAPSSSKRWLPCPWSAQNDLPNSSNPASLAGDIGHDVSDKFLKAHKTLDEWELSLVEDKVFQDVTGLVGVDNAAGIATAVAFYIETVYKYAEGALVVSIENKLFHNRIPEFFGTIDTCIYTPGAEYELTIIDLKTGKGKQPAKGNTQLQSYACFARQKYETDKPVRCIIVQDRVYAKPQVACFSPEQLDDFERRVDIASRSTEQVAGKHCYFCPLQNVCDAYAAKFGEPR